MILPGVKSYLERIIQLGFEADGPLWDKFQKYSSMVFKKPGDSEGTFIVNLARPFDCKRYEEWIIAPGWRREDGDMDWGALSVEESIAFIEFISVVETTLQKRKEVSE